MAKKSQKVKKLVMKKTGSRKPRSSKTRSSKTPDEPQGTPMGDLPEEISKYIGPRLELGEILFENLSLDRIRGFALERLGDPGISERICAEDGAARVLKLRKGWEESPTTAPREEIIAWLLAIGVTTAHLRDNNISFGGGLSDLLRFYEYAGECAQVVRWLRTGKIQNPKFAPVAAMDWFVGLVPQLPHRDGATRGTLVISDAQ